MFDQDSPVVFPVSYYWLFVFFISLQDKIISLVLPAFVSCCFGTAILFVELDI